MNAAGKAENRHKYMMGGIIVKYFPQCYRFEESELNRILSAALATQECRRVIGEIEQAAGRVAQGKAGSVAYSITISDEERACLKSLIKTRTIQAQVVDLARMLLWKSEAKTDKAIADGLGVSVNTVRRCIDRYLNSGISLAVFDDERSGRPDEITDDAKSWIVSTACQKPCDLGYAAELWTLAALHKHIQAHAEEAGCPRLKTETRQFLAALPEDRFVFVFTPTHTSWLNMIESFFSKMTKQMRKGIRVNSKEELSERIYRCFDEINADPIVYHWTYKMDEIDPDEATTI